MKIKEYIICQKFALVLDMYIFKKEIKIKKFVFVINIVHFVHGFGKSLESQ